ncbi:hypothetical protein F5Y04DRAFT_15869 [Hypomontagnella monticulosa]|nr:hypothetical protein F5Y04DRAFT_15869 [Hypomontagnella monticulosa]
MVVKDKVSTYRLRPQDLKNYLTRLFGREISVHASAEGESIYWFKIPRPLRPEERDHIYERLRYVEDEEW